MQNEIETKFAYDDDFYLPFFIFVWQITVYTCINTYSSRIIFSRDCGILISSYKFIPLRLTKGNHEPNKINQFALGTHTHTRMFNFVFDSF